MQAAGQILPRPEGAARITPLDRTVKIVPVVEDSYPDLRRAFDRQAGDLLPRLEQAEEMKNAIKNAAVTVGGDGGDIFSLEPGADDQVALFTEPGQFLCQSHGGDDPGGRGGPGHNRAMAPGGARLRHGPAQEPAQADLQLPGSSPQHRRIAFDDPAGDRLLAAGKKQRIVDPVIAQPEPAAVLGSQNSH